MYVGTYGEWMGCVGVIVLHVCIHCIHFFFPPSVGVGMPGLHVYMCVYVCRFPDVFHLEIKQASPLTPALSLKSLIGPQSLEHSSLSMIVLLFSSLGCFHSTLWLCRLAGRQAGRHQLTYCTGLQEHCYGLNQCRM